MYFIVSKTAGWLASPSNVLAALALFGLAASLIRPRRWIRWLALSSLCLLVVMGASPLGTLMISPLENRFSPKSPESGPVDGIIVLGGALNSSITLDRRQVRFSDGERLLAMADLARRYPEARIIFTGGSAALLTSEASEADVVQQFAETLGLESSRIELERTSRNTAENARNTARLLGPIQGRWLLVTSAFHMPRAQGLFRKAGLNLEAFPVSYRTRSNREDLEWSLNWLSGLELVDRATREWIGLAVGWISGQSDELFPDVDESQISGNRKGK